MYKVTVILGDEDVRDAMDSWYQYEANTPEYKKGKRIFLNEEWRNIIVKCFQSAKEREAYIQGINDASGLVESIVLKGGE